MIAKPVFSIALIFGHWKIDPSRMGLVLRDYDSEPNYFGSYSTHNEKNGLGNGHTNDAVVESAPAINAPAETTV